MVVPSAETDEEVAYLDDMLFCQDPGRYSGTLYNNSDAAWWLPASAVGTVYADSAASLGFHRASERYEGGVTAFLLPGDYATIRDARSAHWFLDAGHTAGWLVAERLAEEVEGYGEKAIDYFASKKSKMTKAVWACSSGAVDLGTTLAEKGEQLTDAATLVDVALDLGVASGSCERAWNSAAKARGAKAAELPSFSKVTAWAETGSELRAITREANFVLTMCGLIPRFC